MCSEQDIFFAEECSCLVTAGLKFWKRGITETAPVLLPGFLGVWSASSVNHNLKLKYRIIHTDVVVYGVYEEVKRPHNLGRWDRQSAANVQTTSGE